MVTGTDRVWEASEMVTDVAHHLSSLSKHFKHCFMYELATEMRDISEVLLDCSKEIRDGLSEDSRDRLTEAKGRVNDTLKIMLKNLPENNG